MRQDSSGYFNQAIQRVRSLHEQTYQALRAAILSGEFVSGERLVEVQLAAAFQVSRTPIREAIRQLQRDNLVVTDEGGGICVASLSAQDAEHLYDCRMGLEELAVAQACVYITNTQIKHLKKAVEKAEKSWGKTTHHLTPFQLLHMDYEFHRLIAESSGNPWLISLLDQVFDKMTLIRIRTMQHNPKVLEIRGEHRQIYEAIAHRDPKAAVKFMHQHLEASRIRVVEEIQQLEKHLQDQAE
ncbi:MAG: GntR family transcriptional regulator [Synechococcales bacterium]|nr:GntR family transcriptional regulator [Synechococcales bacterium]